MLTGHIRAFADLQLLSVVGATLSFIAILFGNWLYIFYRAKTPDSARAYFLKTMPDIHAIFFEFKEFAALFTLPLMVCAAFILWRYGNQVLDRAWLRYSVAILLGLSFFYLVTLSALAWLGSWVILHYALRGRELSLSRWVIVFLVGVGLATTLIWPPVFEFIAHLI